MSEKEFEKIDYEVIFKKINDFFVENQDIHNKAELFSKFKNQFQMEQARKILCNNDFSIRFSSTKTGSFSNTVLSLSALVKVDDKPFITALVRSDKTILYLTNTSFLNKISHSSKELRVDNIKGSFNGPDIMTEVNEIKNEPTNFAKLFVDYHLNNNLEDNISRLAEKTNNISPSGKKFELDDEKTKKIYKSIDLASEFIGSAKFDVLFNELKDRVALYNDEILAAARIDNVKDRGMLIEYIITSATNNNEAQQLVAEMNNNSATRIKLQDGLSDYSKKIGKYFVHTDIKTKIMPAGSAPKAYNIDKFLEVSSNENAVFMFFFVCIDLAKNKITTKLVSVFDEKLVDTTRIQHHWAGRNSRGVTQFDGKKIEEVVFDSEKGKINNSKAAKMLKEFLEK